MGYLGYFPAVSWIYDEHRLKLRFMLATAVTDLPLFHIFYFPFFIAFLYDSHVPRKTSQQHHINVVKLGKRAKLKNEMRRRILFVISKTAFISHRFGLAKHAISLGYDVFADTVNLPYW